MSIIISGSLKYFMLNASVILEILTGVVECESAE
jgi:hypothetical protein